MLSGLLPCGGWLSIEGCEDCAIAPNSLEDATKLDIGAKQTKKPTNVTIVARRALEIFIMDLSLFIMMVSLV